MGVFISSSNIAEIANRDIDFVGPESGNKSAEANRRKSHKHHGVSEEYEARGPSRHRARGPPRTDLQHGDTARTWR